MYINQSIYFNVHLYHDSVGCTQLSCRHINISHECYHYELDAQTLISELQLHNILCIKKQNLRRVECLLIEQVEIVLI